MLIKHLFFMVITSFVFVSNAYSEIFIGSFANCIVGPGVVQNGSYTSSDASTTLSAQSLHTDGTIVFWLPLDAGDFSVPNHSIGDEPVGAVLSAIAEHNDDLPGDTGYPVWVVMGVHIYTVSGLTITQNTSTIDCNSFPL